MKRLVLAGLAAALLSIAAPAAHASHASYRGGCGFSVVNDTTSDGPLGGETTWKGVVYLATVFTDSTANRPTGAYGTVWCELRVDGVPRGTVLGPTSGLGEAHDARLISFVAPIGSFVILCDHVTIDGETLVDCSTTGEPAVFPQPLLDAVAFVDNLVDVIKPELDPVFFAVCSDLPALAPTVDGIDPDLLSVAPDGDVSVQDAKLLDCAPYDDR